MRNTPIIMHLLGQGLQAALPPSAFKILREEFGVHFESFASPLNCFFTRYCSAFPDTDAPFGFLFDYYELCRINERFPL